MTANEPESPGGWVVDLRNPEALQRALEAAGGMPPRKGRKRKDQTPKGAARPALPATDAGDLSDDDLSEGAARGDGRSGGELSDEGDAFEGDDTDADEPGDIRTTTADLPRRASAPNLGTMGSALADDGADRDDVRPLRRGDEALIAQAHVPASLGQQRRRRQWAIGGTTAVAVVACVLLVNGLRNTDS